MIQVIVVFKDGKEDYVVDPLVSMTLNEEQSYITIDNGSYDYDFVLSGIECIKFKEI